MILDLNAAELEAVEELASHFFNIEQIAAYLGKKPHHVKADYREQGALWEAYQKGAITADLEVRKSAKLLAKQGSSPAQTMMLQLREQQKQLEP